MLILGRPHRHTKCGDGITVELSLGAHNFVVWDGLLFDNLEDRVRDV